MEKEELKPCPFCGGDAECYQSVDTAFRDYKISCNEIGCIGAATNLWFPSEELAIMAWNRRV